ncbi:MAG TPA: aminotransferase class IV [Ktedonobacteraceae bacterium]|nr:aminotransferase class IV [Ktedonobacteraceae bacterium]
MDANAWWYIDGQWVHPQDAVIPVNDVAVLRGYSAFESLRTYDRRPFHMDEHLTRLYHSADLITLKIPFTRDFVADVVRAIIKRNSYKHASVRILVTGGVSDDGIYPSGKATLAVLITELEERDIQLFERGIKLITTRLQRNNPDAKTSSYAAAIHALKEAAQRGATDALYMNGEDQVLEGTRSNFFMFLGDTLVTPRTGILKGVTRNLVLALAEGHFKVEERPISLSELSHADEAFVTSSSKEITPVIQVDDQMIGNGEVGPRTYKLEQLFILMIEAGEF